MRRTDQSEEVWTTMRPRVIPQSPNLGKKKQFVYASPKQKLQTQYFLSLSGTRNHLQSHRVAKVSTGEYNFEKIKSNTERSVPRLIDETLPQDLQLETKFGFWD